MARDKVESMTMNAARSVADRMPILIGFSIPVVIVVSAYLFMAVSYHRVWLFDTVVHENGKYTLLEVMLYFRHFTWELPMKILYSFMAVGAFFYYGRDGIVKETAVETGVPGHRILLNGLSALAIAALAIVMTVHRVGMGETLSGLLQTTIAETKPSAFGSHWRNHFLSNTVLYSSTAFVIIVCRILFQGGKWKRRGCNHVFLLSWVVFSLLTIAFGFSVEQFTSPSYLGHQLRETFGTDLPITMLLVVSMLFYLEDRYEGRTVRLDLSHRRSSAKLVPILWLALSLAVSGFLIYRVLNLDLTQEISKLGKGRKLSVLDIFAWHFFEHTLDYIFVLFAVYFLYGTFLGRELKRHEAQT